MSLIGARHLRSSCSALLSLFALAQLLAGGCQVDDREPGIVVAPAFPVPEDSVANTPPDAGVSGAASGGMAGGNLLSSNASEGPSMPTSLSAGASPDTAAPALLLALGQACSASSAACEAELRCVGGSCRLPCVTTADCGVLGAAVDCTVGAALDGSGVGACSYQSYCDPARPQAPAAGATACAAGAGCRPSESGESTCQPQPGEGAAGSTCSSDAECAAGYFCGDYGTCRRYCLASADCGNEICSPFVPPRRAGDLAVGFCASPSCDPVHAQAPRDGLSTCPEGSGCVAGLGGVPATCTQTSATPSARYGPCADSRDCRPGLFCADGAFANACNQFCMSDADCPGERCQFSFGTSTASAGPYPVGYCAAVCNPTDPSNPAGGFGSCPAGFGCLPAPDGLSICVVGGTLPRYARCIGLECAVGHYCGTGAAAYCSRLCLSDADCGAGTCIPTNASAGDRSVGTCAEGCNPANPQSAAPPFSPCPEGFACDPKAEGQSQCYLPGTVQLGEPCGGLIECASGMYCVDPGGFCREYCFTNADCERGRCTDTFLPPIPFAANREVFACTLR